MKIIFINRFFYPDHSATSQLLGDLVFYLAERGWQVEVVTSRQLYDDAKRNLPAEDFIKNVHVRRVWSTRFGRCSLAGRFVDYVTFYMATFIRLLKDTRSNDILVAETDPPLISVIVAGVATLRSARLINWVQDLFPEVATALDVKVVSGAVGAFLKRIRNWSLKKANMNVVLGDRMSQRLASELSTGKNIRIIHNWSDSEQIHPVEKNENPLLEKWSLEGKFVVGYSGNMGRAHDFKSIIKAAGLLKKHSNIVFLFIGGGVQKNWITEQKEIHGLTNIVIRDYQPREDLSYSLGIADLHLISLNPALEGLIVPSKFYGIAAVGKPILFVGDVDGEIARILKDYDCGSNFMPGDSVSMADYILHLASSTRECEKLGRNARSALVEKFSMDNALKLWDKTLKSVGRCS